MPVEQLGVIGGQSSTRRSRGLADIAPQYVAKSGLCAATEMESSRGGSIRIQHLTSSPSEGRSRFPKLDECAHFHYDQVELSAFHVCLYDEELKSLSCEQPESKHWHVSVTSQARSWVIRRSYNNFRLLDAQLHRCIYDRKFSSLTELPLEEDVVGDDPEESVRRLLTDYLTRLSQLSGNIINCGPVLNWFELDNRGRRLLVPDGDNCPINTPAVAAAYSVKRYTAQAGDEISFEVGDMISVIDMPPPEESIWWRGKHGFEVGFFPCECVTVIGDKVPRNLQLTVSSSLGEPSKPVLRKHGKLIAFFRSFILSRPSRRRLKQSGILKERVFGCDLGEHLLNSGHEIPMVLKCCAEFIESNGIVDGIYRLSGVTSNIQKLRNAFDEDRVPALYEDEAILQDIHSVASLLKMYFRELPNPLCTYQLYHSFVGAVQSSQKENIRLHRMRDAVQKLPPPHYRTLEYLMRHLARVAEHGQATGMTPRNVAIVWAPNLLRCKELEVGGVAALQGVGVQAVVTEFLVCYTDLIFAEGLPPETLPLMQVTPKKSRPKSLAISTPTKLLSLEEARNRALMSAGKPDQEYIEVGGGPSNLPAKYHTVLELPGAARKRAGSKRSPLGWKSFFSKSGRKSAGPSTQRKASTPTNLHKSQAMPEITLLEAHRRLRPVKSAESLASGLSSCRNSAALDLDCPTQGDMCSPADGLSPLHSAGSGPKQSGHNRSVSHDSYFDHLAETPVHQEDSSSRPSELLEEGNEDNMSSSLDLSEIQLNFDLEETEMRILSEDETLVCTSLGSGSLMSGSSPRVARLKMRHQAVGSKRHPLRDNAPPRARPEDPLSGCPSADPSPKKQRTSSSVSPTSSRSKRSRLEEQLACSPAELRYIDSQSPDNQLVVHADVHRDYCTPGDLNSDNESFTLLSSGLTTPDTPLLLYAPLLDDETNSSTTTPDYENLTKLTPVSPATPCGRYERLGSTPSPTSRYENVPSPVRPPETQITIRYENVVSPSRKSPRHSDGAYECFSPVRKHSQEDVDGGSKEESDRRDSHEDACKSLSSDSERRISREDIYEFLPGDSDGRRSSSDKNLDYESPPASQTSVEMTTKSDDCPTLMEAETRCSESIPVYESLPDILNFLDCDVYEPVEVEEYAQTSPASNVYQNIPKLQEEEEHVYEDIQNVCVDPDAEVYQQVKYFRRSVHEINQLLDGEEAVVQSKPDQQEAGVETASLRNDGCSDGRHCGAEQSLQEEQAGAGLTEVLVCAAEDPVLFQDDQVNSLDGRGSLQSLLENRLPSLQDGMVLQNEVQSCDDGTAAYDVDDGRVGNSDNLATVQDREEVVPEKPREGGGLTNGCPKEDELTERTVCSLMSKSVDAGVRQEALTRSPARSARTRSASQGQSEPPSPERRLSSGASLDSNRRKFESEIGRDILRERKMRQELELFRSAKLGPKQLVRCNIKELVSKFEVRSSPPTSPEAENVGSLDRKHVSTPKLARRRDTAGSTTSLPPCVRARMAKAARSRQNISSPLSVSLDEDQFLLSRRDTLVRVQTSPDVNYSDVRPRSHSSPPEKENVCMGTKSVAQTLPSITDTEDPQRRERIERIKEERRLALREKYRSESFKGERDEVIARLKQKTVRNIDNMPRVAPSSNDMMRLSDSFKEQDEVLARLKQKTARNNENVPHVALSPEDLSLADRTRLLESFKERDEVLARLHQKAGRNHESMSRPLLSPDDSNVSDRTRLLESFRERDEVITRPKQRLGWNSETPDVTSLTETLLDRTRVRRSRRREDLEPDRRGMSPLTHSWICQDPRESSQARPKSSSPIKRPPEGPRKTPHQVYGELTNASFTVEVLLQGEEGGSQRPPPKCSRNRAPCCEGGSDSGGTNTRRGSHGVLQVTDL